MPVSQSSSKAAVSVSEMAEICQLSRSRFYNLIQSGSFPKPVQPKSAKRPLYDQSLQQICLEIRRTCIGANGHPILFNRMKKKTTVPTKAEPKPQHAELIDALGELGLKTDAKAIATAITALFPAGIETLDQGKVLQKLFRHLKGKP